MKQILLVLLAGFNLAFSQTVLLTPFEAPKADLSTAHLKQFSLYELNVGSIQSVLQNTKGNIYKLALRAPDRTIQLELYEYSLLAENRVRYAGGLNNSTPLPKRNDIRTFKGIVDGQNNSLVSMTVADGFLKLMINDKKNKYFLELYPDVHHYYSTDANKQRFVWYKENDVIPVEGVSCGATDLQKGVEKEKERIKIEQRGRPCVVCLEVQIGLAADFSMLLKHGGPLGVENFMIGNLADVQTVFDDEFRYELQYQNTGLWVATDKATDPFDPINDITLQLTRFQQIADVLFSGAEYDVATCWSSKYTTGIIGIAFLPGVCMSSKYNVCSSFIPGVTSHPAYLTLQAHELGHNWSCIHDASNSPTIMCPFITQSTTWSITSFINLMNYIDGNGLQGTCLFFCPGAAAPSPEFMADITYGCQPVTVQFTDQSSNTDSWKWSFPGGNPTTSTLQNPVVIYRTPGLYEVTLEASNARCDVTLTKSEYIDIRDLPVADFSFGVNPDREVFFINNSQRGIDYLWNFGDGEFSEEYWPAPHRYERDTTYEVTLTVTNECGTRSIKKKVTIVSLPIADFYADTIGGCAPKVIQFLDNSTNNVIKWQWECPGGTPSVSFAQNPFIRYDNPGVYDVKLTVYSAKFHHTLTRKLYITIDSLPDADFTYSISGVNDVLFTSQSRYAKSHFWDFGDNTTSTDSNPSHTYLEGRYEVLYVAINACGNDTMKSFVTIGAKPIAGFQVENAKGCLPFQVQFMNTSTKAANAFRWYFPGGNPSTSTDKDPIVSYDAVGKYPVSLYAYNNFYSDSIGITDYIEVITEPTAAFNNVVSGFKSTFTHQAKGANIFFWDFGDNKASFEENPVHDYGVEGEFNVRLIVQNECGLDTFDKHIAIYLVPKVNFTVDTIRGCAPLKVKFLDRSSIDVNEWEWLFENGNPATSTEKNPEVVFNKKGRYTVKLNVKNTNGSNQLTRQQYIQVLSPVFCPERTKTPAFMLEDPLHGSIQQRMNEGADAELPFVFPVPARDYIYVYTGTEPGIPVSLSIYDLSGKKLGQHNTSETVYRIETNQLRQGTYYIRVVNGAENSILKFAITE